jgi:hypothetical protein
VGDDRVDVRPLAPEQGVLGREAALRGGALRQHHPSGQVAGCPDVPGRGAQGVVDHHVAPLDLHGSHLQAESVGVPGPADREQHFVGVDGGLG